MNLMKQEKQQNSYIVWFAAFLTAIHLLVAAFNIIMDPYNVFKLVDIEGINHEKPMLDEHIRLSMAYELRHENPRSVILGSSRAMRQLYCSHPGWSDDDRPCYNMGFLLANAYEVERYFQHANRNSSIKKVVYGLDFYMFNNNNINIHGFDESRLSVGPDGRPQFYPISDLLAMIISIDATKDSLETLLGQQENKGTTMYPGRPPENGLPPELAVPPEKQWDTFMGHSVGVVTSGYLVGESCDYRLHKKGPRGQDMLGSLESMAKTARNQGIKMHLFISPVHAYLEETKSFLGLWPYYEDWKRELVRITTDAGENVTLWDFSGYNTITTDPPPTPDGKRTLNWYWDCHHYKKSVGDMILDRILRTGASENAIPPDFGIRLTTENIEAHLAHIRQQQRLYRDSNNRELRVFEEQTKQKLKQILENRCGPM